MSFENFDNDTITSEILHCEERLLDAMRNSDIDHLDFLIHDDLIYMADGIPVSKMMALEKYRSEALHITTLDIRDQQIRTHGDTAVVSVVVTLAGTIDDQDFGGEFQYLRVWKAVGESWKVIAGSSTKIA